MRLLAFSDLHRDRAVASAIVEASSAADCVIGCGDFATETRGADDVLSILRNIDVPLILVHGNHDNPAEIAVFCNTLKNATYLHGGGTNIDGVDFFGIGGEIPRLNNAPWNAYETEETAEALLSTLPDGAILVTHAPPYMIADIQRNGEHEGSKAIRRAIESHQPKLCLCGHIHNAWGMSGDIGASHVHNLGPRTVFFDI